MFLVLDILILKSSYEGAQYCFTSENYHCSHLCLPGMLQGRHEMLTSLNTGGHHSISSCI